MGIMKRLFPKSEPSEAEVESVERSVSEIAEDDNLVLLPILKSYDWPAKDVAVYEHYLNTDKPPIPLVAYGYDSAENYLFLTREDQGDRSLDEIRAEAMENLQAQPAEWIPAMPGVLTASGQPFAAEKLLDTNFLIEAQQRLGAETIAVIAPRRTVIYAADAALTGLDAQNFHMIVAHTLQDDSFGNAFITNLMFEVTNGSVTGARIVSSDEKPDGD